MLSLSSEGFVFDSQRGWTPLTLSTLAGHRPFLHTRSRDAEGLRGTASWVLLSFHHLGKQDPLSVPCSPPCHGFEVFLITAHAAFSVGK